MYTFKVDNKKYYKSVSFWLFIYLFIFILLYVITTLTLLTQASCENKPKSEVVSTPFTLSFDYITTCDTIITKFERVAPTMAQQYGPIPVVGVGHSCGSLLHLLITTLFSDTPRAGNVLMSYNNMNVKDAVPFFMQF